LPLPTLPMTPILGRGLGCCLGGLIAIVLVSLPPLSLRCC
jgi:hypothetical protein